jgi:hypothetical protein
MTSHEIGALPLCISGSVARFDAHAAMQHDAAVKKTALTTPGFWVFYLFYCYANRCAAFHWKNALVKTMVELQFL